MSDGKLTDFFLNEQRRRLPNEEIFEKQALKKGKSIQFLSHAFLHIP